MTGSDSTDGTAPRRTAGIPPATKLPTAVFSIVVILSLLTLLVASEPPGRE